MSTAQVVNLDARRRRLECSACGAGAQAGCDCGAAYVVPVQRAADALKVNPGKSDRAIAREIGVSAPTVAKARSTVKDLAVGKRVGRDGRARKMPTKKAKTKAEDALTSEVNGVIKDAAHLVAAFGQRFRKFVKANPDLPEEARQALSYSLQVQAEELMELAGLL